MCVFFFFQAEDGIRDTSVTGVQTCALPILVDGGMGFASQNDRRLHFGLGHTEWVDRVVIHWPSGTQQVLTNPSVDRLHTIRSEERCVGKECRSGGWGDRYKKKSR